MTHRVIAVTTCAAGLSVDLGTAARLARSPHIVAEEPDQAGGYAVILGQCNSCHTPSWQESGGQLPPTEWLTGSSVGFTGVQGTAYPANLRLVVQGMSKDEFVSLIRGRPEVGPHQPMPCEDLRRASDADLRAIYEFIKGLGAVGEPAPAFVPAGQDVRTPRVRWGPYEP